LTQLFSALSISAFGIFPASVGLNIVYLAVIFVMGTLIAAVALIAIVYSTRHPEEGDSHALAKYERHWVIGIVIIFIIFSVSTLAYLPYPYAHTNIKPTMVIDVQAQQFSWCLSNSTTWGPPNCVSDYPIPVGNTVLFNVTSIDVTHGFGVYDSAGAIQFQVQVMPGFYNDIMYQFTSPGIYYVRCLEFCGYGHYGMFTSFNVTSS
jgi:cytochrome c oxidase subunit II